MHDGDDTAPRPSSRAVERLADTVGTEVRDLRGALQQALAAADRHESEGRQDLAIAVLEEQRELLARVHQRLETELAGAAVEREAEGVLAAVDTTAASTPASAVTAADVSAEPEGEPGAAVPAARAGVTSGTVHEADRAMIGRLVASAAAAVLGIALLLTPDGTVGSISIAAVLPSESDPTPSPEDRAAAAVDAAEREAPTAALPSAGTAAPRRTAPRDADGVTAGDVASEDATDRASTGGVAAEPAPGFDIEDLGVGDPQVGDALPTITPSEGDEDDVHSEDAERGEDAEDGEGDETAREGDAPADEHQGGTTPEDLTDGGPPASPDPDAEDAADDEADDEAGGDHHPPPSDGGPAPAISSGVAAPTDGSGGSAQPSTPPAIDEHPVTNAE